MQNSQGSRVELDMGDAILCPSSLSQSARLPGYAPHIYFGTPCVGPAA
jgi:hypothetical protein